MASSHTVHADLVLLDIEGTVCPISFVHDVLFPYALATLPSVLAAEWNTPAFLPYQQAFPAEHAGSAESLLAHVEELMSRDVKIAYLKSLQGYLWRTGYESGALSSPLFADVQPALTSWRAAGIEVVIYSSGSVAAQKLLFQYTQSSANSNTNSPTAEAAEAEAAEVATTTTEDLNPMISAYFDTVNAGMKNDAASYEKIATSRPDVPASRWLFLSDNVREVEAAKRAGMQSFVVVRPGNAALSAEESEANVLVESFAQLDVKRR